MATQQRPLLNIPAVAERTELSENTIVSAVWRAPHLGPNQGRIPASNRALAMHATRAAGIEPAFCSRRLVVRDAEVTNAERVTRGSAI
jgi:hypothetical protein